MNMHNARWTSLAVADVLHSSGRTIRSVAEETEIPYSTLRRKLASESAFTLSELYLLAPSLPLTPSPLPHPPPVFAARIRVRLLRLGGGSDGVGAAAPAAIPENGHNRQHERTCRTRLRRAAATLLLETGATPPRKRRRASSNPQATSCGVWRSVAVFCDRLVSLVIQRVACSRLQLVLVVVHVLITRVLVRVVVRLRPTVTGVGRSTGTESPVPPRRNGINRLDPAYFRHTNRGVESLGLT